MCTLIAETVARLTGSQDRHELLAAGAGDLDVQAKCADDGLAFVLIILAEPGEGLLERAVVAQDAHLHVHLEQSELGALLKLADALADCTHQDLSCLIVLLALGWGELQHAGVLTLPRQLDDLLCAAQAERLEEHNQAVLDHGRILDALFEGDLDPLAKDGGFGEGLGADEGEESAEVGELVLDWCTGETPP